MKIETWGFLHCTQIQQEHLLRVKNEKFKGITHTCSHTLGVLGVIGYMFILVDCPQSTGFEMPMWK